MERAEDLLQTMRLRHSFRILRHAGFRVCAVAALATSLIAVPFAGARVNRTTAIAIQAGAKPEAAQRCADGIEMQLSSMDPRQGSLQLVAIRSAKPLAEVSGEWDGNQISFWHAENEAKADQDVYRALLGIDLEQKPGQGEFAVSFQTREGESLTCSASLTVRQGEFETENLKVAPQFVEPDAEQLARAKTERERLRAIFATVTPEKLWDGHFRIPIVGAKTGGNFGKRRVLNGEPSSPHGGVDIPAPSGTPVHASQAGHVVLADSLYFSGNTVIVDHGLGIYTLYGHLSAFAVKSGDMVGAGQLLGKVGATGRVTGPHLHWGLTVDRARVNSLDILRLL